MARTGLAIVVVSQTHIFIDLSNVCRLPLHMRASHKLRVAGLIEVRHTRFDWVTLKKTLPVSPEYLPACAFFDSVPSVALLPRQVLENGREQSLGKRHVVGSSEYNPHIDGEAEMRREWAKHAEYVLSLEHRAPGRGEGTPPGGRCVETQS